MTELLRVYTSAECGADGYPLAWRGGVDGGPRIPDVVREAAGHRCVRCGHPYRTGQSNPEWSRCDEKCVHMGPIRFRHDAESEWESPAGAARNAGATAAYVAYGFEVEAEYRVLTVHHLTGEKADCRWWNLAALCQRCHLYIQGRVKMHQVYPFEHTPWFRPYAAGYYAAVRLGEDLDRKAVESRQDELLELERAA